MAEPIEAHVEALVAQALGAEAAAPAGPRGRDRDEVAGGEGLDAGAEGGDVAGDLVAEDHRLAQPHRAEAAVQVVVEIRAADAAAGEPHAQLAGTGIAGVALFEAQIRAAWRTTARMADPSRD